MITLRSIPLAVAALFGAVVAPVQAQSDRSPSDRSIGSFFPDVELPTIDGSETLRLSELEGQRLLLIEFASW